jgi:MFS family permease
MAMGLGCQALAFMLMGPAPVLPIQTMRKLETGACMVFSQVTLGIGNALTLIAGFPFLEGACEVTGNAKLTQPQRIAVAGTWYNAAFSFGCAMGPLITGTLQEYIPFADTLFLLSMISVVAIGVVVLDGVTDRKATGGFLANNLSTTEHSVKVWNSMGDKFRDWAMSESAGDGTELHEYNSGPGTVADLRQSLSSHVGSEAISSTPIGRTSLSSPSQSTQTRRKGVNAIRAALINEILAAEMGWEDGAEEKQRKRQPLSYAYNLLLVVVAVVVVGCLVATVVEGDKEPCRPFYAEKSAIYGCSNRLTVGLFTDDYHMRHCHSLHSRTANASTNMRYYPHPPDNPTGCVLVRTNPDTDCVMGDIDKKARTCLC